jgi:O-antigen/teichoic acid export membrane protein/aminoglycoside phosphotransferase (APT) family kinase protein
MVVPPLIVSARDRFRAHLRVPIYRNGYALTLNTALASVFGLLFWILAAHTYTTAAVGLSSVLINTMGVLSNVSQLNLVNVLNRFVPVAHKQTARFILAAYAVSGVVAFVVGLVFILGSSIWADELSFLGSSPLLIVWFCGAAAAWSIFALEDGALIGLRQVLWVPLENVLFSLLKILLLVAFALVMPRLGIFAAWTVAALVLIFPVNLLIFRRLIPAHVQVSPPQAPIRVKQIAHFAAGDYFGSLISNITQALIPLIIIQHSGPSAAAFYFLAWTVASPLTLMTQNNGMALVAEAAAHPDKLGVYSWRVFVQTARLLVPVVAVVIVAAPYVLTLFGNEYASEAVALLRLLTLAAIPTIITSLYISVARVQERTRRVLLVRLATNLPMLLLSVFLLDTQGIAAIGLAWVVSQSVVAAVLLVTELGPLWSIPMRPPVWLYAVSGLRVVQRQWQQRRAVADALAVMPDLLRALPLQPDATPAGWSVQRVVQAVNDVTVVMVGPTDQPRAVVKLPQSQVGLQSVLREQTILTELHADARLETWHTLAPVPIADGTVSGQPYAVISMLPGVTTQTLLADTATRQRVQRNAARAIMDLHQRTAEAVTVDDDLFHRWVGQPLTALRATRGGQMSAALVDSATCKLETILRAALVGRTVAYGWMHGDYVAENILCTPDGSRITGIVDWELSDPCGLPMLDIAFLLLTTRRHVSGDELAAVITTLLNEGAWAAHEQDILDHAQRQLPGDPLDFRAAILLCWLRHVATNLSKSVRYTHHSFWITRNVEAILRYIDDSGS